MVLNEMVANLPQEVMRYAAFVASLALLMGMVLVGIQMLRGDALICADGSFFATSCPGANVGEVVAREIDERLPGAIDEHLPGAIDRRLLRAIDERLPGAIDERLLLANVPIGTIVPYFGRDEDIPSGWVLCDGRENPIGSQITIDANSDRGGIQLPDLTARFIRGANAPLNPSHVQVGGSDTINTQHSHRWVHRSGNTWSSYDSDGNLGSADNWGDGIHNNGSGTFPFNMASGTSVYTELAGEGMVSNLPGYVELRFIIKIF
ncbi:MAG: tail fiber protein [Acidobacteria bacterium]|nr:tail fiber protein [Acidobacteriota bacterium]